MKKCLFVLLPVILVVIVVLAIFRPEALRSLGSNTTTESAEPPIILVHGFNQSSNFWDHIHLIEALEAKKYKLVGEYYSNDSYEALLKESSELTPGQSACYKLTLPANGTKDIRDSAILLEKVIAEVTKRHHSKTVKLISFSAGGVVCRDYLTKHLHDHKVESLTTVSAPHLGSEHAWIAEGYHNFNSLISAMEADRSGNLLVKKSRKYAAKGILVVTKKLEQWSAKSGIDINSQCARMLARPVGGNYLAKLSEAPHPHDISYHCIITEENLFNYDLSKLQADFAKIRNGKLSQTDLITTVLDLGRYGLGQLDKISEQFSSMKFRGDGVVSKFSQDLNNTAAFKNSSKLSATTTHIETKHGGPEICTEIMRAIDLK